MRHGSQVTTDVSRAVQLAAMLLVVAGLFGIGNRAFAEDAAPVSEETTARARTLIESLLKERERIVSAVVHVRGSMILTRNEPLGDRTIRGMYAFDHSLDALRFDSSRRMTVRVINAGAVAGNNLKAAIANAEEQDVDTQLRYVRTRDVCASWTKSTNNSNIYEAMYLRPSGRGMGGSIATNHCMIDPRACGVMSYFDFINDKIESGQGVKEYCDAFLEMTVVAVSETQRQAVVVLRSEFAEHRLTIDTARQFTPVEYCRTWKKGPGNSSDGSATSRVKWAEVNGVMVPNSFSIEFDVPDEKEYCLYNFICLWQSVNQPIDKNYFDYKGIRDIPLRTDVVDLRKPGSPTIGFWTAEGIVGPEEDSEDSPSGMDPTKPQPGDARNEQTLIAGNKAGQERDDNGLKMRFAWCTPGEFVMGSPKTETARFDGEEQVEVVLTQGFWIGKCEVTQGEWTQLKTPLLWEGQKYIQEGDEFPATYLSWDNAMDFCRKLTSQERAAGRLPPGWQYTLPTEAQWEYACRGGTTTRFSFGDDLAELANYAWTRENAAVNAEERHPQPVGQKQPNPFGLYDMHGNVSEWCRDGWQKKRPGGTDPFVPPRDELRVIRGGSWNFPGVVCRSAYRDAYKALDRSSFIGELGFRVVLCPVERTPE